MQAHLGCFAVRRGQGLRRADVSYNLLTDEVNRRLAHPRYDLTPISSFEVLLQYGCSKRATEEAVGYRILRMNNLQAEGWALDELKYVELTPAEFATWRLERGDIVFNRTNSKELVGKCEVFDEEGDWVFASYLMRLRVDPDKALPEFVTAFLNTRAGRVQIDRESRQIIGMANINAEEIRTLRIPLPKPTKQGELLGHLNAARDARRRKLGDADELLGGLDAFILNLLGISSDLGSVRRVGAVRVRNLEGPLNPERYLEASPAARLSPTQATPLDQAFQVVEEKVTPSKDAPNALWDCLRIDDLGNEPIDPPQPRRLPGAKLNGAFFRVRDGDLLIARLGPPLLNGKIVVVRDCGTRAVCSPEFLVLRPRGKYDADVAMWVLRSRAFRRVLYSKSRGSTPSRYRLIRGDLSGVMLPKLKERQERHIAVEVARRRAESRGLREEADQLWEHAKAEFEIALLGPAPEKS